MYEVNTTKTSAVSEHLHHKKASYPAKHFVDNSQFSELLRIIEQNPLATLVFSDKNQQLHLSHIPFHLSEQTLANINTEQCDSLITQTLLGHVSNHHPVAQQLTSNRQINCEKTPVNISLIFHGEEAYISPNDVSIEYSAMQKVPTWNYAKIHIEGYLTEVACPQQKLQQMAFSTEHFERFKTKQDRNERTNWSLNQAPEKAIEQMLKAITVFTLTVTSIEGRFKLSQNKPTHVREQINNQLIKS